MVAERSYSGIAPDDIENNDDKIIIPTSNSNDDDDIDELRPLNSQRFGGIGITSAIPASLRSLTQGAFTAIADQDRANHDHLKKFNITTDELSDFSKDRSREAFIVLLEKYVKRTSPSNGNTTTSMVSNMDSAVYAPSDPSELGTSVSATTIDFTESNASAYKLDLESDPHHIENGHEKMKDKSIRFIQTIIRKLRNDENIMKSSNHNPNLTQEEKEQMERHMEMAALALTTIVLRSSPEAGISADGNEINHRIMTFGANAIAEKKLTSFVALMWDAVQDFVLIMLIVMGVITISVETTIGLEPGQKCGSCWLEGFAILTSVCIVVLITAGIDYGKQLAFRDLSKKLETRNTKSVIRDGQQVLVTDAEIVVGDILSVNSHSLASISADCVLLGPNVDLRMNESSLTGESNTVKKRPGDVILSGTNASEGSGKMVVIAVGINSVAGKIKARVYESEDHDEELEGDEETPLFLKLDTIAKQIGLAGTGAAGFAFVISAIIGFGVHKEEWKMVLEYLIVAITVLAVAVPEGLPLAVTLSLAFSSRQMMSDNNMVKTLSACETMGCATTICTDKTGECRLCYVNNHLQDIFKSVAIECNEK